MLLDGVITEKKILFAPSGVTLFSLCVQSVLALVCLVSQISAFVTPTRVSVNVFLASSVPLDIDENFVTRRPVVKQQIQV